MKKIYYGWFIVIASVILMFTQWGMANHPLNLYVIPVTEAEGYSRTSFSMIFSIINFCTAITYLFYGSIDKWLGPRKMIVLGCIMSVSAFALFSLARNLALYYLAAVIFGVAVAISTNSVISQVINEWFFEKRGTILGFVFATSGIGATLCDNIIGRNIERYGYRTSLIITTIAMAVFLTGPVLLVKEKPEKMGLKPYGKLQIANDKELYGPSLKECLKLPIFWMVFLAELFWGVTMTPIVVNIPAFLNDQGLDSVFVSGTVMAILFAMSAVSKFVTGYLCDRFGIIATIAIIGLTTTVATLLLPSVNSNGKAIVMAILMGIGYACISIPPPLLVSKLFGNRAYASILGFIMTSLAFGAAIGIPISNYIFDLTGSYSVVFYIQAGCFVAAAVLSIIALNKRIAM